MMRNEKNEPLQRELVIAALISPGHADNSVTIPLGYGRKPTGPIGEEAGFNTYLLRTAATPHFAVADGKAIENVKVTKAGGTYAPKDEMLCVKRRLNITGRILTS
jgi:hypothetical protein